MSTPRTPLAAVQDMYDAYLDGDRERLEENLDATCTLWDSGEASLITKTQLQLIRRENPPAGPDPIALQISEVTTRELPSSPELVVLTHIVTAVFAAGSGLPPERMRVSSVLHRTDRWRILHHHEEPAREQR